MVQKISKACVLVAACLCVLPVRAAALRGLVRDKRTGEALIGVTVRVKEMPRLCVTTGLDGSFYMKDLPDNKPLTLECRYVSYEPKTIPVAVGTDRMPVIELEARERALSEVTVVGHARKNTDKTVRDLELRSMNVVNVMSAQTLRILPDLNVGGALQRMSGVVMEKSQSGEGSYAILRGMDKRYNYSLVNGVKMPSPNDKDRYIPLNIFPSELLDRLEVTKSLTPDMEGDASGGVVNMIMKDAPARFAFEAHASAGYGTALFERDFTTFGHSITEKSPRERYGSAYQATSSDFASGPLRLSRDRSLPDLNLGFSAGNRFFDNRLGVMLAASVDNCHRNTKSLFYEDAMSQTQTVVHVTEKRDRTYSEEELQYGAHLKLDYKFSPRHTLAWYNALIGSRTRSVRESRATSLSLNYDPANGNYQHTLETRSRHEVQTVFSSVLKGKHTLTDWLSVDWAAVLAEASDKQPDATYVTLDDEVTHGVHFVTADNAERRFEHNSDRDRAIYLNFKATHRPGDTELEARWGGLYRTKARENRYVAYNFVPQNGRPVQGTDFETIDQIPWKLLSANGSVSPLDYDADEDIGAVYAMASVERGAGHLTAGVRAEHTDQSYALLYPSSEEDPKGAQRYWDLLPSVVAKYHLNRQMCMKASYYRSINRPGFFEIVPYTLMGEEYTEYGNKDLRRAKIDNFDLRWEWFPHELDQLMVGAFYKHIQDPIELSCMTMNNRQYGYGPSNLGNADNFGVEIDLTKYFRNFGIKANYTYTHSSITSPKTQYGRDAQGSLQRLTLNEKRPLVGQAEHVANFSLLYKDTQHGWDANLAGSYIGERMAVVSQFYGADQWDGGIFTLDFSMEKKFRSAWSVFFKASNLLNAKAERYVKTSYEGQGALEGQNLDGKTLIRRNTYGTRFLVGVRLAL